MNAGTHYDVVIIGTGAGGGTLAHRLAPSGKKILLLERGGYVPREKDNWDSHAVNVAAKYQTREVWRDRNGKPLESPVTFRFSTRDGTTAAQLYRNPQPGGPRRTGFEVSTATDLDNVPLGLFGAPPLEVRLHFNQALNPNDVNVPVNVVTDPLFRDETQRGRVYLEYKDAVNDPLSINRAASTRQYLADRGVNPTRVAIDGRGSREPIADNSTPAGRAQNRRVEIFVGEPRT